MEHDKKCSDETSFGGGVELSLYYSTLIYNNTLRHQTQVIGIARLQTRTNGVAHPARLLTTWDDARFLYTLLVPFLAPPDVVCILSTSRGNLETYDTAEVWKALAKAFFGPLGGSRGHRSRRQRKKKTTW